MVSGAADRSRIPEICVITSAQYRSSSTIFHEASHLPLDALETIQFRSLIRIDSGGCVMAFALRVCGNG